VSRHAASFVPSASHVEELLRNGAAPCVSREPAQLNHSNTHNLEPSVLTIDGTSPINPAEVPGTSLQRVARITVIHDFSQESPCPETPPNLRFLYITAIVGSAL
jgi:hypothetical protein